MQSVNTFCTHSESVNSGETLSTMSKDELVMDSVISHAALAWVHYDDVFDNQFELVCFHSPVWGKNDMWDDYYIPWCDDLKEMWDEGMREYLNSLKE